MATPYLQVSPAAQDALTEFSSEFDQAFASAQPDLWAEQIGLVDRSEAIKKVYPIPVSAAGYKLRKGDDQLRALYERTVEIIPSEWVDGVRVTAADIRNGTFSGWAGEPTRMATEALRQPNVVIAAMLKANPTLAFDGKALFADNHPYNVFDSSLGTFDNDQSASAIDSTMFAGINTRFGARKGANGKSLGARFTHLLVPTALTEQARDFLERDMLLEAITGQGVGALPNRYAGTVSLVVADELEDDNVVYALDGRQILYPWIVQNPGTTEEIVYDESSDLYKDSGLLGIKRVLTLGYAAALPHGIERITITG